MRPHGGLRCLHQAMRPDSHQGVQSQQRRGCAQDRQIGPLPLRFDTKVLTGFLKRCLQPPTANKEAEDGRGFTIEIGAKKGLRVTIAGRIAHQYPADRGPEQLCISLRCRLPPSDRAGRALRHPERAYVLSQPWAEV